MLVAGCVGLSLFLLLLLLLLLLTPSLLLYSPCKFIVEASSVSSFARIRA